MPKLNKSHACRVAGCDNRVSHRRYLLGHRGCKALHQEAAPARNLIPLPKGNTVLAGATDDLKGIANSHKTGVVEQGNTDFGRYAGIHKPVPTIKSRLQTADEMLLNQLRVAKASAGGVYIRGDRAVTRAYRLGWVTAAAEPARLTKAGLLARAVAQQNRVPHPLEA